MCLGMCIGTLKVEYGDRFMVAIVGMNSMFTFVSQLSRSTLLFHPGVVLCCKALKERA